MYHPKQNWTISVRQHLNDSLGVDGLISAAEKSKPNSFISHPLPECSCRASSKPSEMPNPVIGADGRILYGDEERCPEWLSRGLETVVPASGDVKDESDELPEDEPDLEQQELDSGDGNRGEMSNTPSEQDEEMDPED